MKKTGKGKKQYSSNYDFLIFITFLHILYNVSSFSRL